MQEELQQGKILLEESKELLDEVGPEGLSGMIVAAIVKAKSLGPRAGKALIRMTFRRVCHIYLEQGGDPLDLSEFAIDILSECNNALKEKTKEELQKQQDEQVQRDADDEAQIKASFGET